MPLSQDQIDALKNPETMIEIQMENPKKPGSKAAERFDRYKAATTIQDATTKGANWQDLSSDFEKGFLKVCGPKPLETIASGSTKRAAPEGTPDREAEARSKIQSTDLVPKALPELTESVSKVEMSAATISLLRTMIRDEIKNSMLEMEHRFSAKLDNAMGEVKEELCVERASRQQLEERVAKLEQQHVREQAASTAQMFEDEDVDKSVVVVGGFGDQALEDAEALVQQMMVGIAGFKEVDMVNVEQPIALATFDTPASALKFIRTQKKNHIIQTNKLWAAENRSKTERTRCKIVSKLKKYLVDFKHVMLSPVTNCSRPAKNRRFTSPLHEMDGDEEAAEGSPVQSESTTQELTRDVERLSVDAIARIVRSEIQDGLQPLQAQVSTLNSSMSVRMERVEGEMKSVKDKMSEQEVRIAKLETYLSNVGRETATPRSMDGDANFETRFAELKSQMDMLTTEGKGKVDTSSGTNQSCTMVVGGLLSLNSLKEATTWMADILQKLNGPTGQEMYMKTKEFQGILFVKFGSSYERDVATAVVRSAQLTMGETHVWATPDLPIPVRARKVFLLGLRWQLGEWGFPKREIVVSDDYKSLLVGDKVVLQVMVEKGSLSTKWSSEWSQWEELHSSIEMKTLFDRSNTILKKQGKGSGKSKMEPGGTTAS
eukprot:symbB.v1.2.013933.t1/scaffold996.1/size145880/14